MKIKVGKEYEVQQRFATVEQVCGSTVVCRDRFDNVFECDIGYVKEKKLPKSNGKKFVIYETAAGHACSECGRGFCCWLGPDESPCRHTLEQFRKSSLRQYLKRVPQNKEVREYLLNN